MPLALSALARIVVFGATSVLAACQSSPSGYTTGREHYALTEQQRKRLEQRAAAGDERAAVRLLEYHAILTRDEREIARWERRLDELRRARAHRTITSTI